MSIAFRSPFPFDYLHYDYLPNLPKQITSGDIEFRSFNFNNAWPRSAIPSE